ncbi:MAG: Nif3-like dinuclear metal center hexameric protein [Planctomycetota bacterium]|nr:Nif3-like dinuclear metal center hexameric protein [Planctomycetota bacterium]
MVGPAPNSNGESSVQEVLLHLNQIAPLGLAESWDNVGLLAGDPAMRVKTLMTCLSLTDSVLEEAIRHGVNLIVVHHPVPFKPIDRITTQTTTGKLLWDAIRHCIAIYSPHTAWDNAPKGINRQLAQILQLGNLRPLQVSPKPEFAQSELGSGIVGEFATATKLSDLWARLESAIPGIRPRCTDPQDSHVGRVGIVCGSGASLMPLVLKHQCEAFVTGEATYHQSLEAQAQGVSMLLMGHFASERFAMHKLASMLQASLPNVRCFASQTEQSDF